MCSSSSNWAHYLPTHTICILISTHTIHRMGIIQTVNRLVHLVPFLLTLQLYHPSPSCTLGLFHPFHHVHNKKQSNVVKLLNNRIKKCRGCGAAFSWKVDGSPPEPPNNLVICHEERRPFSDAQNTPITTYRSRIDDICGPSLYIGHEDRDVAPKNTVSVDASNSSHSQVHVSGSMCSSSSNWAHYLPTHTICILISTHTIHRMGIIQTVNRLVHLVPFLLTLQLYHPSPSCTLGLFHPFHHVHNKKQSNVVKLLNNRIKKCRGCGAAFSWKVDGSPPEPPNNLVICHEEQRPFSDAQNVTHMNRPQNVYYHPIMSPAFSTKTPSFIASEIQVPADLELLCHLHEEYLEDHFGWRSTTF